ncbi:unnamed protein product [Blepharisma stoltei]|uniref:Uncharacterized protein n=1 Tax=Blepharisma stoltei TaxID=1481888 RepID=A0AAU9J4I3_9CILI|nr:unnamed protein product [Blepharisma stoltei]
MTDIGNYFINSAIDLQIQNPQKIPASQRQKFREISTKPNQEKLRLYKELSGLVKSICCDIHTKTNGILINIENGEVL